MHHGILPGMDRDLLDRWRRDGDEAALADLIGRLAPLLRAAARAAGSPDADEAAQAACVLLARRPGSVPPGAIAGWAVLTARRIAANQRRAAARRRRHEQEAARMPHPGPAVSEDDLRAALDDALARLSPARREAIVRFHLLGHSQSAIAAELGCSVDAVKIRIHEGIVRLRGLLVRRGHPVELSAVAALLATVPPDPGLAAACRAAAADPSPVLTALLPGIPTMAIAVSATFAVLIAGLATVALVAGGPGPASGSAAGITVADAGEWLRRGIPAGARHRIDRRADGTATAYVRDAEGTLMISSDRGWILGLGDGSDAVELTIGMPPRPRPATSAASPAPGF
jgi:RNA polymerase sigma factor (sigma-70 family)